MGAGSREPIMHSGFFIKNIQFLLIKTIRKILKYLKDRYLDGNNMYQFIKLN